MSSFLMFLAVFAGGTLGSLLRDLVPSLPFGAAWSNATFAVSSTFTVNILACFAIGWLFAIRHRVHPRVLHFGAVGFCGGLSTFSAFAADIAIFAEAGQWSSAIVAPTIEIAAGLLAAWLGEAIGSRTQFSERSSRGRGAS